eukprot:118173-Amphidinium_carterae.1
MRSHLTLAQAAEAGIPATYHMVIAEADLLASQAVQEILGLPPLLPLFRQAASSCRGSFSSLGPRENPGSLPPPNPHAPAGATLQPQWNFIRMLNFAKALLRHPILELILLT